MMNDERLTIKPGLLLGSALAAFGACARRGGQAGGEDGRGPVRWPPLVRQGWGEGRGQARAAAGQCAGRLWWWWGGATEQGAGALRPRSGTPLMILAAVAHACGRPGQQGAPRVDTQRPGRPSHHPLIVPPPPRPAGLNVSVFLLIGKTSALTMNIAGVVKDWCVRALAFGTFWLGPEIIKQACVLAAGPLPCG